METLCQVAGKDITARKVKKEDDAKIVSMWVKMAKKLPTTEEKPQEKKHEEKRQQPMIKQRRAGKKVRAEILRLELQISLLLQESYALRQEITILKAQVIKLRHKPK